MTKRSIKRDPILAMASMLGAEPVTKPRTVWSVGEVQRPDAGGTLYAPVRVLNNEFIEHGMTPSHDRATMERAVEQLNATPKPAAQHRTLSTRAVAIIGNAKEWNIVTESGDTLARFAGTMLAAEKCAAKMHQTRVRSLLARALNATWQSIGSDVESSCKSAGVKLTNASAYESILDCGHLEHYGPDHSKDKLTMDAINEFRKLSCAEQLRITRKMLGKLV